MVRSLNRKEKDLFERIVEKEELRPIFFRKVKGLHWFDDFEKKGFFKPGKNPKPEINEEENLVHIPLWPVTEYLVKSSKELKTPENETYAKKFVNIIVEVTDYAKIKGYSNHHTWLNFAEILKYIPCGLLEDDIIDAIEYWLKDPYDPGLIANELGQGLISSLIGSEASVELKKQLLTKLMAILFELDFKEREIYSGIMVNEVKLKYSSMFARDIIDQIAQPLGEKFHTFAPDFLKEKLIMIFDKLDIDKISSLWRPAIEEHEQNRSSIDVENLILSGFRDCIEGFLNTNVESAKEYIRALFDQDFITLKRVAIYMVDKHYNVLKELIELILVDEYFTANYRHEMWHLLNDSFIKFSTKQKEAVLEIIEEIEVENEDGKRKKIHTAYKKSVWYKAITEYNETVSEKYKECISITGEEPKNADFSSYISVGWDKAESTISLEEFVSLENSEIADFINNQNINELGYNKFKKIVYGFKNAIKTQPERYYKDLRLFKECDVAFINSIVTAYNELWNDQNLLPWNKIWKHLFNYLYEIVQNGHFWLSKYNESRPGLIANRYQTVVSIGGLIENVVKKDDESLSPRLMSVSLNVLKIILDKEESEEFNEDSDAVSVAINSPRGKCIEALINHSLRSCRLEDNEKGNHEEAWSNYVDIYKGELNRGDNKKYEFATLVALYLPNFLYMSSDWVEESFPKIFDQTDELKWLCAMQGVSYVNYYKKPLYEYFKEHGDLIRVLNSEYLGERVKGKFIEILLLPYIFEDETYEDSLIATLIERKNYEEINSMILFVRAMKNQDIESLSDKVFEIWRNLMEKLDFESDEDKRIASSLSHWSSFIEELDPEQEEWLNKIAPFTQIEYNSHILIKELARISNKEAIKVQPIWLKMIDSYPVNYPKEAIKQILQNLVKEGGEGISKEIVDSYILKGNRGPHDMLITIIDD